MGKMAEMQRRLLEVCATYSKELVERWLIK
jgi:hypothetical protein